MTERAAHLVDAVLPRVPVRQWVLQLMRRAFDLDVLACPRYGGRLRLIALLHDPRAIGALLAAASQASESPDRSPPI